MVTSGPDKSTRAAVELLAAADAVAAIERPTAKRRHWWRRLVGDPLVAAVIILAAAVVFLSILVASQGNATAERAERNAYALRSLGTDVGRLSSQLSTMQDTNRQLLAENQALRKLLTQHGIKVAPVPAPQASAPLPQATPSRAPASTPSANLVAPPPFRRNRSSATPAPAPVQTTSPSGVSPKSPPRPPPSPSPSPSPSHTPCILPVPLSTGCLL